MLSLRKNWANAPWLLLSREDLLIELQQATDEGRDISVLRDEFDRVIALDLSDDLAQRRAELLLDRVQSLPLSDGYGYVEPSDQAGIRAERPPSTAFPASDVPEEVLQDKILGGWLGRCCGCLLGKPFEGRKSRQIEKFLRSQNRWPLARYASLQAPAEIAAECGMNLSNPSLYEEGINAMVEDDDTNYTAAGLALLRQRGAAFTPEDVAAFWLSNIPVFRVCTAERAAYRNLVACIPPPTSACFRNPYREWIGAQIRADIYGYVNPSNPVRAAEFAWRDASISHVKNGIYGAMWVAAMIAAAFVLDDPEAVIRAGLSQVPQNSRLFEAIAGILAIRHGGATHEQALETLRKKWNEEQPHAWCHTISNASIVAAALLWGGGDFEATICLAVMPGFDTDCNGATAGSIAGVMLGAGRLPSKWTAPLRDTLYTGVAAYPKVAISEMARETAALAIALRAPSA